MQYTLEQKEKSNKADKLKKKIQAIEPELIAAQNKYNDIYNKIGADWTYNQHKQIDTKPSEEEFKKAVWNKSRDNARTPMQWDDSENAGFTTGKPWFALSDRYREINVKEALADKDSIFYYYKKLIEMRHQEPLLTEGSYELILAEEEHIFAYLRKTADECWLVAANLSEETIPAEILKSYAKGVQEVKIANYAERKDLTEALRPYEAFMMKIQ